jgi:hypothetical protein
VGCGYCCKKAQCVAGASIYGLKDGVCTGLKWNEKEQRYYCLLILETTGQANRAARQGLAIGAGCSSSMFNTYREETIARRKKLGCPDEEDRAASGCANVSAWPSTIGTGTDVCIVGGELKKARS